MANVGEKAAKKEPPKENLRRDTDKQRFPFSGFSARKCFKSMTSHSKAAMIARLTNGSTGPVSFSHGRFMSTAETG